MLWAIGVLSDRSGSLSETTLVRIGLVPNTHASWEAFSGTPSLYFAQHPFLYVEYTERYRLIYIESDQYVGHGRTVLLPHP